MKIDQRLRCTYDEYHPRFKILMNEVEDRLAKITRERKEKQNQNWFFFSRVKTQESFALKTETGRVKIPSEMEDFFACTVIVPTLEQLGEAKHAIGKSFKQHRCRPRSSSKTHKRPSDFVFDDLRIYASLYPLPGGKHRCLDGVIFEIQIKTALQHAWGAATHDLIYKAPEINWPRERIAFQIKAMLEHADLVIAEAARLEEASSIAKQDCFTTHIKHLIEQINEIWPPVQLPDDVRRLAMTIHKILSIAGLTAFKFSKVIDAEKCRYGILPKNLSPYAFTIQALSNLPCINFKDKLNKADSRTRIVIHNNMDLPEWMNQPHPKIIALK